MKEWGSVVAAEEGWQGHQLLSKDITNTPDKGLFLSGLLLAVLDYKRSRAYFFQRSHAYWFY